MIGVIRTTCSVVVFVAVLLLVVMNLNGVWSGLRRHCLLVYEGRTETPGRSPPPTAAAASEVTVKATASSTVADTTAAFLQGLKKDLREFMVRRDRPANLAEAISQAQKEQLITKSLNEEDGSVELKKAVSRLEDEMKLMRKIKEEENEKVNAIVPQRNKFDKRNQHQQERSKAYHNIDFGGSGPRFNQNGGYRNKFRMQGQNPQWDNQYQRFPKFRPRMWQNQNFAGYPNFCPPWYQQQWQQPYQQRWQQPYPHQNNWQSDNNMLSLPSSSNGWNETNEQEHNKSGQGYHVTSSITPNKTNFPFLLGVVCVLAFLTQPSFAFFVLKSVDRELQNTKDLLENKTG
jgi:hypothetical protein